MTQTAQVIGTAQYLSPEQARGERVDARSDLYSTGCLLYELLTGRPPFLGDSPVAIAYQHVRENPVPPSRLDPEIPDWADAIVLRAMAKSPSERYQSAADMRTDIKRALSGVPVAAPTDMYGRTQRMDPGTGMPTGAIPGYQYGPEDDEDYDDEDPRRRRRRTILLWALGVLVVLAVVGGVAYAVLGGGSGGKAVPQVNGLTVSKAEKSIKAAGLNFTVHRQPSQVVNKNIVISTSPPNGNKVSAGTVVTLNVSSGPPKVQVPDVHGKSVTAATNLLRNKGFQVNQQTLQNSTAPANTVVRQSPAAFASVKKGSTITLFVSPGGASVPNVVGENIQLAQGQLQNRGFSNINVNDVSNPQIPEGTVIGQSPHGGNTVPLGTQITLTVVHNASTPTPTPTPTSIFPSPTPSDTSTPPSNSGHGNTQSIQPVNP
jgi:serine/threonine-protein kinase